MPESPPRPPFLERAAADLLDLFGAGTPTPGAGSAAALQGALAASLLETVARHTLRAAKTREVLLPFVPRAEALLAEAALRGARLRQAVDDDAAAFERYAASRRRERSTPAEAPPAERAALAAATSEALRLATDLPLAIARECLALAGMALELFDRGYRAARGEASAAALAALAGGEAAAGAAHLNLGSPGAPGALDPPAETPWKESRRAEADAARQQLQALRQEIEARLYGPSRLPSPPTLLS